MVEKELALRQQKDQHMHAAAESEPAQSQSVVICDPSLQLPVASVGIETVKAIRAGERVLPKQHVTQRYYGILPWQSEPTLQATGALKDMLPDFRNEVLVQTAMSAAGVSLPMHGSAAVGHGVGGLYTQWKYCEGVFITQPWVRILLSTTLGKHHDTSPHAQMDVGIICLSRPDFILSSMSLEQARWLHKHSKLVQRSLSQVFRAAVERGFVHLAADQPANVALATSLSGRFRVYLLHWSLCAERVRFKVPDQSEVMQYVIGLVDGTVDTALRLHDWSGNKITAIQPARCLHTVADYC
jgi:hypothetical protein